MCTYFVWDTVPIHTPSNGGWEVSRHSIPRKICTRNISLLIRLPIKSLIWFSTLSKDFNNLFNHQTSLLNTWISQTNLPLSSCMAMIVHGLLCLTAGNARFVMPSILIWNPATRQVKRLPKPSSIIKSSTCLSFGFTSVVNNYKVVLFQGEITREVEVHSLKIGNGSSLILLLLVCNCMMCQFAPI